MGTDIVGPNAAHGHDSSVVSSDTVPIDMKSLSRVQDFGLSYHEKQDTLFMRPETPRAGVSFDWNGEFWLRLDPETGEVVGIEVDDFEQVFLKKHPELAQVWSEIKPTSRRLFRVPRSALRDVTISEPLDRIISGFLLQLFQDEPCQARFSL